MKESQGLKNGTDKKKPSPITTKKRKKVIVGGLDTAFSMAHSTAMDFFWNTELGSKEETSAIELLSELKRLHKSMTLEVKSGADVAIGRLRKKSEITAGLHRTMIDVYIERAISLLAHLREEAEAMETNISE